MRGFYVENAFESSQRRKVVRWSLIDLSASHREAFNLRAYRRESVRILENTVNHLANSLPKTVTGT